MYSMEQKQGYDAYYDDVSISENPYSNKTELVKCIDWRNGWLLAQYDDTIEDHTIGDDDPSE